MRRCARDARRADGVRITLRKSRRPHFKPDVEAAEPLPPVRALSELLIAVDAVLVSSPEYAHGAPGASGT